MQRRSIPSRIAASLTVMAALLVFAGAGCKPFTTASEPDEETSKQWNEEKTRLVKEFFAKKPFASFAHVQPGVRSEIYIDLTTAATMPWLNPKDANEAAGQPSFSLNLTGPGVLGESTQRRPYAPGKDERFTWSINRFGNYVADINVEQGGATLFHTTETIDVK